jgi:small-conductance mechanosensitive channel
MSLLEQYWPIWIALLGSYIFKNWIVNFLEGFAVYLSKSLNVGDVVLINGDKARIIKIGFRSTIFHILKRNTWLIIRNDRVKFMNIEKILENYNEEKRT